MSQEDLGKLYDAILTGDTKTAVAVTQAALAAGTDPQVLVNQRMIPAMNEVGRRFDREEYFLPELLVAARAMKGALNLVRPLLAERGIEPTGRVVIGTVKGDMHDIGKSLVGSMLEGGGFQVTDLGVDVPPERFVAEAKAQGADIIALSALLTTTMTSMKSVLDALVAAGGRDKFKVIIGGAPVTQAYADSIGADGYSASASSAVTLARKLLGVAAAG
ncbi:MAG: corrinoid protein [Planctomycetes bacterium]|nr:corrinoid protein [Planctomycetota bacterium]